MDDGTHVFFKTHKSAFIFFNLIFSCFHGRLIVLEEEECTFRKMNWHKLAYQMMTFFEAE
jgi:hypothetical protein